MAQTLQAFMKSPFTFMLLVLVTLCLCPAYAKLEKAKFWQKTHFIQTEDDLRNIITKMAENMQDEAYIKLDQALLDKGMPKGLAGSFFSCHVDRYRCSAKDKKGCIKFKINFMDNAKILAAYRHPELLNRLTRDEQEALNVALSCVKRVVKPGMSRREITRVLHDEIVRICEYDKVGGCVNALINHRGSCGSYAKSLSLMLGMVGISSHIISGKNQDSGSPHAWNMVQMDEGKWYHVDVCKDDRFGGKEKPYKHFGVTDEHMEKLHRWNRYGYPPTPQQ